MTDFGLVGEKLGHSRSPEIHRALSGKEYALIEVSRDNIDAFFDKKDFIGINVTIPYKQTVIPHLDFIDPVASEIGAVNTVVNRCGKLYGYNTDHEGMSAAIVRAGIDLSGKKVLILGTGGTSKTAEFVVKRGGAKEIVKVSRGAKGGAVTYADAYERHSDADVIINTTPCGMYPNGRESQIDISRFPSLSGVFDAVYNPIRTRLVLDAARRGIPCSGGLYMLVYQAVRSSEYFNGTVHPDGTAEDIFAKLLKKLENVVLIGMPSSGKTTVGRIVSRSLGREFFDTDALIESSGGKRVPDIINERGEEYFRDAETRAVLDISARQSCVIATGGGAVLREENVDALKQNGRLYFLDRPLNALEATPYRPLSSDRDALEKRYRERYGVYRSVCDRIIDSSGDAEDAAREIINDKEN